MPAEQTSMSRAGSNAPASGLKKFGAGCGCVVILAGMALYVYFGIQNALKEFGGSETGPNPVPAAPAVVAEPSASAAVPKAKPGAQELARIGTLYAPIDTVAMMLSARAAVTEKGHGNIKGEDLTLKGSHVTRTRDGKEETCLLAYTVESSVPVKSAYAPMTVRQFCELALADGAVARIVIDPGTQGEERMSFTRTELEAILPKLPASAPLPVSVERTQ